MAEHKHCSVSKSLTTAADCPHEDLSSNAKGLVSDVISQCPASGSCNLSQPPIILSSDFCELTSRFDGEGLIKVDSVLTEPSKYLEEVSVFDVDGNKEESHHDLDEDNLGLDESMQMVKGGELESRMHREDGNQAVKSYVLHNNTEEIKDARMNMLDTSPFLMGEGVVFQYFPVSEKEVFIVNLEDETLLMNESLSDSNIALPAEQPSEIKHGILAEETDSQIEITSSNIENGSQCPILDTTDPDASVTGVPISLTTSCFGESERNFELQESKAAQCGTNLSGTEYVTELEPATSKKDHLKLSRKDVASVAIDGEENLLKEVKVTHATIYALPPPLTPSANRKIKKSQLETEEITTESFKCRFCSETLPSFETLRHHLVTRHQQRNIDTFICFICKQECWSASQQDWHLRIQHGIKNKNLACPVCGTQFSTLTEFRAHVRKHPTNYTCPSCPQKFAAHQQLTQHVKLHLEELLPYSCYHCDICFQHPKVLDMHMWRHRVQNCPEESCEFTAEDESWLLYHLKSYHKYSTLSVRNLVTARNTEEYRLDILIVKYFQKQEKFKEEQSKSVQISKFDRHEIKAIEGTNESLASNSMRNTANVFQDDLEISSVTINSIVDVVAIAEEEEKKNVKRKENLLRKIFDGGSASHRCGLCNTYHSSPEELALHKAEHNQVLECIECRKSFLSVKQLKRHMTVHNSSKEGQKHSCKDRGFNGHRCLVCGRTFGSESALSRHSSTHVRSEGRHQCKICSRRVGTRAHLTEHMSRVHKVHSESKKMQCPMCDRRFISNFHLNLHLVTHGEAKPLYTCKVCKRNYLRPRSLRRHMVTHDQNYTCDTCSLSFPTVRRLAIHSRSHDPSYKTKVQCSKCPRRFPYKSQLEVHLRTHTGEKPYVCETCGKSFKRLQHCKVHLKVMHGNEKRPCIECGRLFSDKANLLRHRLKVHYHLTRWVCGVCAQSFAYSEDLRRHLKKKHDLVFERLVNGDKKCMSEVYVIPELGSQDINANTRAAIEYICEIEKQKVKQIFSGVVPDLTRPLPNSTINEEGKIDDLDDPDPIQGKSVTTSAVLLPSTTVGLDSVIENGQLQAISQNNSNFQTLVTNEVPGLIPLQVTGMQCPECGIEIVNPHQCRACGVLVCSQAHMDIHMASVHQVLFQCSVCGLSYNSQNDCIAHVTAIHSSHLLAVQGGTTTYLSPLEGQSLENSTVGVPPRICLPVSQPQPNPQCLLQVGRCNPQLPVIVTPAITDIASQHLTSTNCPAPYPNIVDGVTSGIPVMPRATTLQHADNVGKDAMFAMTGIFQETQQSMPNIQQHVTQFSKKEETLPGNSLCTVTLSGNDSGNLCIPSESSGVVMLSKPSSNSLPAIMSHTSRADEIPSIIVGNAEQQDDRASVLLVDSGTTSDAFDEVSPVAASFGVSSVNAKHQPNTSVASVLLTLSETPQNDQSSELEPHGTLKITGSQSDQDLSPSIVTDVSLGESRERVESTPENSGLLQTIVDLPAQYKDAVGESLTLSRNIKMMEETMEHKSPQEINVQIIQPELVKLDGESKASKPSPKKSSAPRIKRKRNADSVKSETHECKTCGKMFSSKAQLKRHDTTHGIRRFKCQICDKAFTEKYNLKIHTLSHTQERPHECNLCFKTFRYLRDLAEHKRMHEGKRPHECDVCQKTFVRQRDLTRHQKEQHDTKRYKCKICGLPFKRLLYLKTVHMKTHQPLGIGGDEEEIKSGENTTEKGDNKQSHICKICGRSFARARYLTSHLRTHSRRAFYVKCPLCPRMFSSEETLKVHKETFHDTDSSLKDFRTSVIQSDKSSSCISQEEGIQRSNQLQKETVLLTTSQDVPGNFTSSQTYRQQHHSQMSKHTLLPSISLPGSVQQVFSAVSSTETVETSGHNNRMDTYEVFSSVSSTETVETSVQGNRMDTYEVHLDECDPITYLAPSFSN